MEQLEYNNWYIIMHNECLLFDKPKSTENIIETENQIESETPIESKIPIESEMPIESETPVESEKSLDKKKLIYEKYNGLLQSNTKMTIKIIKELLEEIGLKTYGKKEELQKRLEEYFTS
jgi:hypothetical protein